MSLQSEILYTTVRVRAGTDGGSGTAIYSQKNESGEYENYVLTCHHVIESAISIQDKWDSVLARVRKIEDRDLVKVEFFQYEHGSRAIGTYGVEAQIAMHDVDHDIALLKLKQTSKPMEFVAALFPFNKTTEIQLLDPVAAVGCALGHPPIVTEGRITSMSDHSKGMSYWMSDAPIIFGNSGGAVFHRERNEFIGIPSKVSVIGWSSPVSHMGYFSDIERIYKVLEAWRFQFIYDTSYTPEQCSKLREQLRREDLELQKRGFLEEANK